MPKQFEYRIEEYGHDYPLEELLNDEGKEGWRFAGTTDPELVILEREVEDDC